MEIVNKKVSDLIPYVNNPRKNDNAVDKVASSIKNFGFKVPVIVDANNEIVAGHTRIKAAKKLGLKEVPCIVADDLTEAQVKAFRIADNRVSEEAEWDMDLLSVELDGLGDFDLTDLGFDEKELSDILDKEQEIIEDDVPEVAEEATIKIGDIYRLGRHRLMCGDATNQLNVQKLMDGNLADMILTDPPYNVDYEGKTKQKLKIKNDHKKDVDFRQFLTDSFTNFFQHTKPGGVFYIFHADSEGLNFRLAVKESGQEVKQCLIWSKNAMVMGRQDYHWQHEPILYGWKSGSSHLWASDRKQTTILNFDRPTSNKEHPTMKPVGLVSYLMKNNTKKMDVVMDLFGGSGTTLIASEQTERTCYMMELDPRYCDVIVRRWENITGEKAELIENG